MSKDVERLMLTLEIEEAKEITYLRNRFAERRAKIKSCAEALSALGQKVNTEYSHWVVNATIKVNDIKEFKKIKDIVGPLKKGYVEPVPRKHKRIRITLNPVDPRFKNMSFQYERKLLPSDSCKIVTRTTTERVMVCQS